jgi:hypothetical protein
MGSNPTERSAKAALLPTRSWGDPRTGPGRHEASGLADAGVTRRRRRCLRPGDFVRLSGSSARSAVAFVNAVARRPGTPARVEPAAPFPGELRTAQGAHFLVQSFHLANQF